MARRLKLLLLATLLLVLVPARSADAQREKLRVGSDAPSLAPETWINGSLDGYETGITYFIFFFEVASDPETMRAVTALNELAGLTALYDFEVIGLTTSSERAVRRFLSTIDGSLNMRIGIDEKRREYRKWLDAAGDRRVDGGAVFVVDGSGKLQYAGVAGTEDRETVFPLLLSQRYDAGLLRRTETLRRAKDTARTVGNWRLFEQHHAELIELDKRVFALENITKFESLLVDRGDRAAAYAFVAQLMESHRDDPRFLLDLARYIADSPKLQDDHRDLTVAMGLVQQAKGSMSDGNPVPLATEALVLLRQGDVEGAVRTQRRAFRVAPQSLKGKYQRTLEAYQKIRDQRGAGRG